MGCCNSNSDQSSEASFTSQRTHTRQNSKKKSIIEPLPKPPKLTLDESECQRTSSLDEYQKFLRLSTAASESCPVTPRNRRGTIVSRKNYITQTATRLYMKYEFQDIIGQGAHGVVRKAIHNETKVVKVIKSILKTMIGPNKLQEFDILRDLDHPNIVRIHEVSEDVRYIHLVMDYCAGGELFDRIHEKG